MTPPAIAMIYDCDLCGACCRTRAVFVSEADARREPRILTEGTVLPLWLRSPTWVYQLYPLPFHEACCFLAADNKCGIYASRPDVCRNFIPGSQACQDVRAQQGLPRLPPTA